MLEENSVETQCILALFALLEDNLIKALTIAQQAIALEEQKLCHFYPSAALLFNGRKRRMSEGIAIIAAIRR